LCEAVVSVLTDTATTPLVLVIDDLQWADRPTLRLLRHLAEHHGVARVLVVLTFRAGETTRSPMSETLADLARMQSITRISLEGLRHEEVAELLEDWAGTRVPAPVLHTLFAETEGNPFF